MTTNYPEIKDQTTSTFVVLTVFFILVTLVALLVVLYMWLNRQTNGQYTVHQLVLGEGGARDRVRGGVQDLEVWFRRRFWPLSEDVETVGEEEPRDEEEDVESVRGRERRIWRKRGIAKVMREQWEEKKVDGEVC